MKLVYISDSFLPSRSANSIQVVKMCDAFAGLGLDVTLIARSGDPLDSRTSSSSLGQFYGIKHSFEIATLPKALERRSSIPRALGAASVARRLSPDVIYSRSTLACAFAPAVPAGIHIELHQPPADVGLLHDLGFRFLLGKTKLGQIITISTTLKDHVQSYYCLPNREILVLPDGADLARTGVLAGLREDSNGKTNIGYVGHLYKGKGVATIIALAERLPNFQFHIVGGAEADIRYWKSKSQEVKNITFHGFVHPAIADTYRASFDVLLAPYEANVAGVSGGDVGRWMSPLKIFEYMSAGKVIIASNLPVLREVLIDGFNSLLVPPGDLDAWELAIRTAVDRTCLAERIGAQAREDLKTRYSWSVRAAKLLESFNKAANNS